MNNEIRLKPCCLNCGYMDIDYNKIELGCQSMTTIYCRHQCTCKDYNYDNGPIISQIIEDHKVPKE